MEYKPSYYHMIHFCARDFRELEPGLLKSIDSIEDLKREVKEARAVEEVATHIALNAMRGLVNERKSTSGALVSDFTTQEMIEMGTLSIRWADGLRENLEKPADLWNYDSLPPQAVAYALEDVIAEGAMMAEEKS